MNTTSIPGTTGTRPARSTRRRAALPALAVVAVLALAGCGSDESDETAAKADQNSQQGQRGQGGPGGPGGAGFPGAFGKVAAVSDGVAQVQGNDGQTAVTLSGATVTTTRAAQLSDLEVGQCVTVSFGSGARGADASDAQQEVDESTPATSVSITDAVDGECSMTGGGFPGGGQGGPGGGPGGDQGGERPEGAPADMPSGAPTDLPSGAPTDMPSGGPAGQGGRPGGDRVSGKVTAVSKSGFTADAVSFQMPAEMPDQGSSDAQERPEPETTTEPREVVVDGDTTFSRQVEGKVSDVTEGRCVMATGEQDETGGLKAETVRVSDAVDGECSMGFGGGRR